MVSNIVITFPLVFANQEINKGRHEQQIFLTI